MFLQLQIIFDIFNLHAGVVQRLVCDLAKVEMAVRFRSLAPLRFKLAHCNRVTCFNFKKQVNIFLYYGIFSLLKGVMNSYENDHRKSRIPK